MLTNLKNVPNLKNVHKFERKSQNLFMNWKIKLEDQPRKQTQKPGGSFQKVLKGKKKTWGCPFASGVGVSYQ